ncbi:unnamed protein product [Penicillium olsonii]|nr:unnamed protein product [Penicillium olsonii]CAG7933714.1 unnamed protein product [Penicillium olsonii]
MAELDLEYDDRSVELSSIVAIFPETQIDPKSPFRAILELPVAPSSPTPVYFQPPIDPTPTHTLTPPTSVDESKGPLDEPAKDVHILSHLPPLKLEIELPEGYPSEKPPIVHLSSTPAWLPTSTTSVLLDDCRRLWEECDHDLVIFTYIDHLQQLAENVFHTQNALGEVCLSRDLKIALLDYNIKAEREKFEQGTFECGVCLEPKKGTVCYRLLRCSHVFCVQCLQDFYNSCIAEGDVDSVKCVAPDCESNKRPRDAQGHGDLQSLPRKKRDRTLGPSELLQIPLTPEVVQRYAFLKRKKKIEADKTTVYCPRQWCQGAARSKKHPKPEDLMVDDPDLSDDEDPPDGTNPEEDDGELPPMAERVAICEDCNYAFCSVCKKGWHGELLRCYPRRQGEPTEEEKATEEYLRLYTTPCPTCNVPCQKQMGCNHMRCFQCDTHFCYLCSAWLLPDNPYKHFNDPSGRCYNRLWDLEGGDGLNPDGAEALHRIPEALLNFDDEPPAVMIPAGDDEEHPAFEFDNDQDILHLPPPPAPIPPPVNARRPDHAAARAAAAERRAQARAMNEVRRRDAGQAHDAPDQARQEPRRPVRRLQVRADGPGNEERADWGHGRWPGLERFVQLAADDREDEWDSDELEDF